jgi:hypothetical protein
VDPLVQVSPSTLPINLTTIITIQSTLSSQPPFQGRPTPIKYKDLSIQKFVPEEEKVTSGQKKVKIKS